MAIQTKNDGAVQSVTHAGTAYSATVKFPLPPPNGTELVFACDKDYYDDFREAMKMGGTVNVTYEDSTMAPSSVTTKKP